MHQRSAHAIGRRALLAAAAALPAPALAESRLRIGGTGMGLAIMGHLCAAYRRLRGGPEAEILPSLGSGGGLRALAAGAIHVAIVTRAPSAEAPAPGLQLIPLARTPLALAGDATRPAGDIPLATLIALLEGSMTAWPDGTPVRLVRRNRMEADWQLLASLAPEMAQPTEAARRRPGLLTADTDQDNAQALESLPGAFGTITLGQVLSENRRVTLFSLNGTPPRLTALEDGRYPMARPVSLVIRSADLEMLAPLTGFMTGPDGRAILASYGFAAPA